MCPAISPSQQRLFGMVDAYQKGTLAHPPSAEVKHLANSMTHKQVHDFAATKGLARGGALDEEDRINAALRLCKPAAHMAMGGFSPEIPYFERREASSMMGREQPYGFSAGAGSGRYDKNNVEVGGGAYVLPADIVAGIGEGNSLAGARAVTDMLSSMPYGIPAPHEGGRERGPPRPPTDPQLAQGLFEGENKAPIAPQIARGGTPKPDGDKVPIVAADGEIIISPQDVARIGAYYAPPGKKMDYDAAMRHGHIILDAFVRQRRGETIKELKSLPGPKNSKEPRKGHVHVG